MVVQLVGLAARGMAGRVAAGAAARGAAGTAGRASTSPARAAVTNALVEAGGMAAQAYLSRPANDHAPSSMPSDDAIPYNVSGGGSSVLGNISRQLGTLISLTSETNSILRAQLRANQVSDAQRVMEDRKDDTKKSWMSNLVEDNGRKVDAVKTDATQALIEGLVVGAGVALIAGGKKLMENMDPLVDAFKVVSNSIMEIGVGIDWFWRNKVTAWDKSDDGPARSLGKPAPTQAVAAPVADAAAAEPVSSPTPAGNVSATGAAQQPVAGSSTPAATAVAGRPATGAADSYATAPARKTFSTAQMGSTQAMLSVIAKAEVGTTALTGYDVVWFGTPKHLMPHVKYPGKRLTQLTIAEVLEWQKFSINGQKDLGWPENRRSSAAGRYQFIHKTLKSVVTQSKLPTSRLFDAATQDILAEVLLNSVGFKKWKAGELSDAQMENRLASQWASLKDSRGRGQYNDAGFNNATTSAASALSAFSSGQGIVTSETGTPTGGKAPPASGAKPAGAATTPGGVKTPAKPATRRPTQMSQGAKALLGQITRNYGPAKKKKEHDLIVAAYVKRGYHRTLAGLMFEEYWRRKIHWLQMWDEGIDIGEAARAFGVWWSRHPGGGHDEYLVPIIEKWTREREKRADGTPVVTAADTQPIVDGTPVNADTARVASADGAAAPGANPVSANGTSASVATATTATASGSPSSTVAAPITGRQGPELTFMRGAGPGQLSPGLTFSPFDRSQGVSPNASAEKSTAPTVIVQGGTTVMPASRGQEGLGPGMVPNPSASSITREYQLYFTSQAAMNA